MWDLTLDPDSYITDIFKVDIFKINSRHFVELQGGFLLISDNITFVIHTGGETWKDEKVAKIRNQIYKKIELNV